MEGRERHEAEIVDIHDTPSLRALPHLVLVPLSLSKSRGQP